MDDRSTDLTPDQNKDDELEVKDGQPMGGISRWQLVVGIIGLVLLLLLGAKTFGAGGDHGPGQNAPGQEQDGGGHEPPSWVPDH